MDAVVAHLAPGDHRFPMHVHLWGSRAMESARKWWFQPYEAGCALVRDEATLVRAFSLHADYLTETRTGDDPMNFYDRGPQLTRSFRALKLWMSMQAFGLDALAGAVERGMTLAERAQELVERRPGWEVATPAQLGVLTFRPVRPSLSPAQIDELTQAVAEATIDDGHALVLTTSVGGRPVLRLCTINPEATVEDVSTPWTRSTTCAGRSARLPGDIRGAPQGRQRHARRRLRLLRRCAGYGARRHQDLGPASTTGRERPAGVYLPAVSGSAAGRSLRRFQAWASYRLLMGL
jgi:Pyridoxal-dependent decarboxylase conserved domain